MMKVKNIFSNRRTKKKKNQSTSAAAETSNASHSDKLIIPTADSDSGNATAKENDISSASGVEACSASSPAEVVLRKKPRNPVLSSDSLEIDDPTKPRASSTSSTGSGRVKSRRPWSFIDQIRRQDSRESAYSTGSSVRTSQVVDELMSSTPPPKYDDAILTPKGQADRARANTIALTLPRSLTPEKFQNDSNTASKRYQSSKRKTIDFRFFNFFKRSGDPVYSDSSNGSALSNASRGSLRGKNKGKKKQGSKKKKDILDLKPFVSLTQEESRRRSSSDTTPTQSIIAYDEDTLQLPPPGLYDSDNRLNTLAEFPETPDKLSDRRVPENGEPALDFVTSSHGRNSCPSLASATKKSSMKHQRMSDPTSGHSMLRMQFSEGSVVVPHMVRSASDSNDAPSRRSSTACEPRELPLPEDSVASFDSSMYVGHRYRILHYAGSVPHLAMKVPNPRIQRTYSNDIPKEKIAGNRVCSQSVTNLPSVPNNSTSSLSILSNDSDSVIGKLSSLRTSSLHHNQGDYPQIRSSVLRTIGYPGVVLRRDKKISGRSRPTSEQRSKLVMSLNVEDLPTYNSEPRFDQMQVSGFPSCEDILGQSRSSSKISSSSHFSTAAVGRARRRGATMATHGLRRSVGFPNAVSVEDLDSLSSSNFGSKQSLSHMDEDELSNAQLSKKHTITYTSSSNLRLQEPSSKKAKAIRKSVVSLANLISPGKPNQKGKLQRSSSFKESGSSAPASNSTAAARSFKPYRPPSNTPNKKNNRRSKLWSETFDHSGLTEGEIKRQEAIFELFQGERDLVQDLTMAKQTYRDSMVTLKMLSDEEVTLIFGKLGRLLPLHEELLAKLEQARGVDGRTSAIGCIFVEWFPRISTAYQEYCANQADAKYALDAAVERDTRVRDFLQRCLESPFSRKLDLWSYLDLPRTRLVKYPLLLQNVFRRTPENLDIERKDLTKVMEIIGKIIEKVDETTGEQQCRYIRSKLEYLDEKQKSKFVENSRLMLCSGQLKNNRGTKMHVFLFEEALVLTRQTTRSNKVSYQVYRHPLPLRSLVVDVNEGEKLSGSFRGGILSSDKVKHSFRVRSEELNVTYTLQASEEHDRKQWINSIQDALVKYRTKFPDLVMDHLENQIVSKRRATYDPSAKKNATTRQVNRSSSDKSNTSLVSSSDRSSTLDESQDDDVSTTSEELTSWRRSRSQTVNVNNSKLKISPTVSRNSSGSSTKSSESSSSADKKDEVKVQERLRRLDSDKNAPSSLRSSLRKKSLTRHFSLGKSDKAKGVFPLKREIVEKERKKCQRSRSLTYSPQAIKTTSSRYLFKKLSSPNTPDTVNAAKPPIAPSTPVSDRRCASFLSSETLSQARSTPDLANIVASASCHTCSMRNESQVSLSTSNSVGNLRNGLARNSIDDARGLHSKAINNSDGFISPSEILVTNVSNPAEEGLVMRIAVGHSENTTSPVVQLSESVEHESTPINVEHSESASSTEPCSSPSEGSVDTLVPSSDCSQGLDASVGEDAAFVEDDTVVDTQSDDKLHDDSTTGDGPFHDEVVTAECPENPLTVDAQPHLQPESADDGFEDAVGHNEIMSTQSAVLERDFNGNSSENNIQTGESEISEKERDSKKYCRSELFEENIGTQNNNIQTAT